MYVDLEVPVLLVDGESDHVVDKPYFNGVILAGASHLTFLESVSRQKVFKVVEEFLGRVKNVATKETERAPVS